jgi:hypothetical protein
VIEVSSRLEGCGPGSFTSPIIHQVDSCRITHPG